MNRIYLDHSATTRPDSAVVEIMMQYLQNKWGNPSSIHSFGRKVKKGLEEARAKVASAIGAEPVEIIFTSGGTEADNLAIKGVGYANEKKGNHIITTAIEHHAVLDACKFMERAGFEVTYVPVDAEGLVHVEDIAKAITDKTILISVMHANNEVGTIQPVEDIGRLAHERGIYFHVDAVQSIGKIPVNVHDLHCDLLSVSAHKIYGPKGVGCLYVRRGTKMYPLAHGGSQERKRRAGTENIPGIVGFGKAVELVMGHRREHAEHTKKLRDKLIQAILSRVDDVIINGSLDSRLPNNVNFSFKYIEGESMLLNLDMKGIAASSGSACTSGSLDPSHVLLAMGIPHEIANGSLRMTLGKDNTEEEIDYVIEVLPEIVERLRAMSPLYELKKKGEGCPCTAKK